MAIDVPNSPRVYTTVYEDFRGVDYTSDATNVWKRRSPDGVNMLPDAAGRPFKRKGWDVKVSAEEFVDLYINDMQEEPTKDFKIIRCYYFELAGLDHIVIFTTIGLYIQRKMQNGTDELLFMTDDTDVIASAERTYFFVGNGISAFYIYGNFRVWKYGYDKDFFFEEIAEDELHIPTIRIGVSANGDGGVVYEPINLLGSLVKERFENNGDNKRTYLAYKVAESDWQRVKVRKMSEVTGDYTDEIEVVTSQPIGNQARLVFDGEKSYIEYGSTILPLLTGEDSIEVTYPRTAVTVRTVEGIPKTVTCNIKR